MYNEKPVYFIVIMSISMQKAKIWSPREKKIRFTEGAFQMLKKNATKIKSTNKINNKYMCEMITITYHLGGNIFSTSKLHNWQNKIINSILKRFLYTKTIKTIINIRASTTKGFETNGFRSNVNSTLFSHFKSSAPIRQYF